MKTLEDYKEYLDNIKAGEKFKLFDHIRKMAFSATSPYASDIEESRELLKYLEKLELAVHLLKTYMIENKE